MLNYLLKGLTARNRESEAHFVIVESSLAPIEERLEIAKGLSKHLERLIGPTDTHLDFYTFLAIFGNISGTDGFDEEEIKYNSIDGILRLKNVNYTHEDWKEARKFLRYIKDTTKSDVARYIDQQDAESLFRYISGDELSFENRYDLQSLSRTVNFIDRTRKLAVIREIRTALSMVPESDSEMNVGRLWVVPAMASYTTGQRGKVSKNHTFGSFDIDCLCSAYHFSIVLDNLHALNARYPTTELYVSKHGNLEFFSHATIPPWTGMMNKK